MHATAVPVPTVNHGAAAWDADEALEQLYAAHWRSLVRLAVLLVHDTGFAEEVVQDAFVAVHERWHRLRDPDRALAYLRQTVVNRSRSALRHRAVVQRHVARGTREVDAPGSDEGAVAAERRDAVLTALQALPGRQREVMALRYYGQLSEGEIADALGISRGAVKSHASRGAAALRSALVDYLEGAVMTRGNPDDQLAALIGDAVADVEPTDRMSELRARTAAPPTSRRWWVAAGGAALATAAAVAAVAVLSSDPTPTVGPGSVTEPIGTSRAVAAYFVGDTPSGPRLYREFQRVVDPEPGLAGLRLLESGAMDPDYSSLWPAGSFGSISDLEAGVVYVGLTEAAPAEPADLALQQLVYTLGAAFQQPLQLSVHGPSGPRDDLGALLATVTPDPPLDVLARVNLSDPAEGQLVDDTLVVTGRANSYEANVLWSLDQDGRVVDEGFFTAEGWMGERLFPFSDEIDVSSLDPGRYTLIVETDDPSGGAEGNGSFTDTRTFVLE